MGKLKSTKRDPLAQINPVSRDRKRLFLRRWDVTRVFACTERGQLWAALTAALLVLIQDQLLDPVHRLLAGQHGPHHHLDLLVSDLGGATRQWAAGISAPTLASGKKKYLFEN